MYVFYLILNICNIHLCSHFNTSGSDDAAAVDSGDEPAAASGSRDHPNPGLDELFDMNLDSPSDADSIVTDSPLRRKKRHTHAQKDKKKDKKKYNKHKRHSPKAKKAKR